MDTLPFYINNLGPAIVRHLVTSTGAPFDIQAGQTFRLRVRQRDATTVLLDKLMTADVNADTVTYQPVSSDTTFTTEGIYRAWVHYVQALQDSDEFEILVLAHAPGEGTRVGTIWRAARALEPVAWDALRGYSDYGDPELQRVIDLSKLRLFNYAVPVGDEVSLDPRVVDYLAKKVLADNVLSAAISFWTNQVVQQSARGNTEEVVTYPDRIKAAESSILRYRSDLAFQIAEVEEILGSVSTAYDAPALNDAGPLLTPGLDEYPALPATVQEYWRTVR
jgi:hypothetical protein